jgi:hypothetical protein
MQANEINHQISKTYMKSPGRHFRSNDPVMHHVATSPKTEVKSDKFTAFVNEYSPAYYK